MLYLLHHCYWLEKLPEVEHRTTLQLAQCFAPHNASSSQKTVCILNALLSVEPVLTIYVSYDQTNPEESQKVSGGSRRKSDRGSTLQVWAWWAWLAWKLDLCSDVVKENPMISILRKSGSLNTLEHEVISLLHAPSR